MNRSNSNAGSSVKSRKSGKQTIFGDQIDLKIKNLKSGLHEFSPIIKEPTSNKRLSRRMSSNVERFDARDMHLKTMSQLEIKRSLGDTIKFVEGLQVESLTR